MLLTFFSVSIEAWKLWNRCSPFVQNTTLFLLKLAISNLIFYRLNTIVLIIDTYVHLMFAFCIFNYDIVTFSIDYQNKLVIVMIKEVTLVSFSCVYFADLVSAPWCFFYFWYVYNSIDSDKTIINNNVLDRIWLFSNN